MEQHNIKCNIRELMWVKRISTITELSEKTEISRQTLHRLEKNEALGVNLETLEKLCNFFECEIHELLVIQKD